MTPLKTLLPLLLADAVKTLSELATRKEPWFFGVGFFKPHLPFAAPKKWHDLHAAGVPDLKPEAAAKPAWPSGWHQSGEFRGNYDHAPGRDPDTDADYARLMRRASSATVETVDVFPTLAELGGRRTVRTERWRLIAHPAKDVGTPQVELFDYETDPGEARTRAPP